MRWVFLYDTLRQEIEEKNEQCDAQKDEQDEAMVEMSSDDSDDQRECTNPGNRRTISIYEKLQCIRYADSLIEEGHTAGIEKLVMNAFPHLFIGKSGQKSGMLGRWITQCDKQRWREIPFEKMSSKDARMRQLPDWVLLPMGMPPRGLDRFKEGKNVPICVVHSLLDIVERMTCGSTSSRAAKTCGAVDVKLVQKEANRLLEQYAQSIEEAAVELSKTKDKKALEVKCKTTVTTRWIYRFLEAYGWARRAPNTAGAYLEYEDERMEKSRKSFAFRRLSESVRLDMSINFDQVWKQSWQDPKTILFRKGEVSNPCDMLRGKKAQAVEALKALQLEQDQRTEGSTKKRRITGVPRFQVYTMEF